MCATKPLIVLYSELPYHKRYTGIKRVPKIHEVQRRVEKNLEVVVNRIYRIENYIYIHQNALLVNALLV